MAYSKQKLVHRKIVLLSSIYTNNNFSFLKIYEMVLQEHLSFENLFGKIFFLLMFFKKKKPSAPIQIFPQIFPQSRLIILKTKSIIKTAADFSKEKTCPTRSKDSGNAIQEKRFF